MHKIDRGARNLRDWADLGEAIDNGIPVRFVHDDLDLHTRAGRLSADIQAVIAADYIRYLREEVKKGIEGRLRQGLYPFKAPRGYRDRGSGRVKTPDPIIAPLIIELFRQYATGAFTLKALAERMATLGLTTQSGSTLTPTKVAAILRNSFYAGIITVRGRIYQGSHQPLITQELFEAAQHQLRRSRHRRQTRHRFRYSRRLACVRCGRHLIGERQKSHVYYRCHCCQGVCVREDRVRGSVWCNVTTPIEPALEPFERFDYPKGYAHLVQNRPYADSKYGLK